MVKKLLLFLKEVRCGKCNKLICKAETGAVESICPRCKAQVKVVLR